MRIRSAISPLVAYASAVALIVSGFVSMDAVDTPAEANIPASSNSLKTKNTIDYSFELDGSSTWLKSNSTTGPIPATANFSIESWIYDPASRPSSFSTILAQRGSTGTGNRFEIQLDRSGYLDQELIILYRDQTIGTLFKMPQDRWVHLALTVSGTTLTLYVDGHSIFTTTNSSIAAIQGPFFVGRTFDDSNKGLWAGKIDQVKIWNGALTAGNVVESMHSWDAAGVTGAPTLLAHYDFNDRSAEGGIIFNQANEASHHLEMSGSVLFEDVKNTNQFNSKTIYTFPRTYLTEVGGWVIPTGVTSIPEALVVGAGGGGGADGGNGGGGGAGQVGSVPTVAAGQVLGIRVGQGGTQSNNGQPSVLSSGTTELANAGGGFGGGGWQAVGISQGGSGASFANFTANAGGAGGEGPSASGERQAAVSGGAAGLTTSNIPNGGLSGAIKFGGGGGGGIGTVDSGTIPAINAASGGEGGGGEGASTGIIGTGKYVCGTATTGTGVSTGGDGGPNTGGGGGAGAAYGTPCESSPDSNYDGERTAGGHGGSGVVVLSVQSEARCVYLNEGSITATNPRILLRESFGFSGGDITLTPTATTISPYNGTTVTLDGWIYFNDLGRSELRRIRTDGSSPQVLGSLSGANFSGLTTDGTYLYGQTSTWIYRYHLASGAFESNYISRGSLGGVVGGIQFWFDSVANKGYLFISSTNDSLSTNSENVYKVPLNPTPASISETTHLFAKSRLSAADPTAIRQVYAITAVGNEIVWATAATPGNIYKKLATDTSDIYADAVIAENHNNIRALNNFAGRVYFSTTTTSNKSVAIDGTGLRDEPGTYVFTRAGINVQSVCQTPTNFPLQASASETQLTADWTAMPRAGTRPQILQYRVNGGAWTEGLSDSTSKTKSIPKDGINGLVEFRVSSFAYGQWSEWTNSAPLLVELYSTPAACANPLKLKYVVPAGGTITVSPNGSLTPVSIRWGDGTEITGLTFSSTLNQSKTFTNAGTYIVEICGKFRGFLGDLNPKPYLVEVIQWGEWVENDATITGTRSLAQAFVRATSLTKVPNTLPATVTDLRATFADTSSFNDPSVVTWNTQQVTNMYQLFNNAAVFNQPIGVWNTESVTNFGQMFASAKKFNQDISDFNTAKATSMDAMFSGASVFNNGGQPLTTDVNKWNTSNVLNMRAMFSSAWAFNQPIGNWNTAKVTTMASMFEGASAFNQPIATSGGSWNTANVTSMRTMFGWSRFNQDISTWNVSKVIDMQGMFTGAQVFSHSVANWNTAALTNALGMFRNAIAYNHKVPKVIGSLTNAGNMLDGSGISDDTYSAILVEWNAATKRTGVTLGAAGKTAVCGAGHTALLSLIAANPGWTVVDKSNQSASFCTKSVTVTAKDTTQVYGSAVPSVGFTVSSDYEGANWLNEITCKAVISGTPDVDVSATTVPGTYATKCSGPTGSGIGLAITYTPGTHTVTKKPLAIRIQNKIATVGTAWSNLSPAVNETDYVITSGSLVGSDTIAVGVSGPPNPLTQGTHPLTGAVSSSKYDVAFTHGTITVSPKSIVVTGKNVTKIYGDSISLDNSTGWVCEGTDCQTTLANKVTLTSSGLAITADAGSYPINSSVNGLDSSEYDVVNTNGGSVTVTKKTLTVTPNDLFVQPGQTNISYTYTISGFVNGDNSIDLDTRPTCTSAFTTDTSRGAELTITCSGGSDNNYDFVYETGELTVPEFSTVVDMTSSQLAPDQETGSVKVPFSFVVTPFLQVCFATLQIDYISPDGAIIPNDPIRVQVTSSILDFEVELYEGEYQYLLVADGNCSIEPESKSLLIAPFANSGGYFVPTKMTPLPMALNPDKAKPNQRTRAVITGSGLSEVVALRIGGKLVRKVNSSENSLSFRLPKLKPGRFDILLVLSDGTTLRWERPLRITGKAPANKKAASFSGFSAGSYAITPAMKRSIIRYLKSNKSNFKTVECVGYTDGPFVRSIDVPLSMNRARVACNLAKKQGYEVLSRSYVNEVTSGAWLRRVKLILGK